MMHRRERSTHRQLVVFSMAISLGSVAGCAEPTGPGAALRDFVIDFARSALAAFLL
jgi:hypothetical protein